ncbi:uncharacterized protein BXIN_0163 [Babesia sp. Xinjiang]|uniref:uncharacterized protein n=1 Tax=Babesia sp. Xinjiang TaxID=462227 RepID=UPI000A21BD12|nr:uncharacterized protein BXIN_0163 [Babesia sp. Xinjiang]ORM39829.1 hypothetical protein BXIN_0163 [Babesia sp. Xinjiang]
MKDRIELPDLNMSAGSSTHQQARQQMGNIISHTSESNNGGNYTFKRWDNITKTIREWGNTFQWRGRGQMEPTGTQGDLRLTKTTAEQTAWHSPMLSRMESFTSSGGNSYSGEENAMSGNQLYTNDRNSQPGEGINDANQQLDNCCTGNEQCYISYDEFSNVAVCECSISTSGGNQVFRNPSNNYYASDSTCAGPYCLIDSVDSMPREPISNNFTGDKDPQPVRHASNEEEQKQCAHSFGILRNSDSTETHYHEDSPMFSGYDEAEGGNNTYSQYHTESDMEELLTQWANVELSSLIDTVSCALLVTEEKLVKLVDLITPTKACKANKFYLFHVLKRFLKYCLGDDTRVYLAGSTAYNIDIDYSHMLGLPVYSDMDLEIISLRHSSNSRNILRYIYGAFLQTQSDQHRTGVVTNCVIGNSVFKLVDSARVPIIIMRTQRGVLCDISANTSNAIRHCQYFKKYMDNCPMLRYLMRIVKHWLKFRGIPAMKAGGFPTVFWMLIFCDTIDTSKASDIELSLEPHLRSPIFNFLNLHYLDSAGVSPRATTILSALEQSFKVLGGGTHLMDLVSAASCRGRYNTINKLTADSQLPLGEIGTKLFSLIEMEPNVPYATWIVYYYEINRVIESFSKFGEQVEILVSLIVCLRAHITFSKMYNVSSMADFTALVDNIYHTFGYSFHELLSEGTSVTDNAELYVQQVAEQFFIKVDCKFMVKSIRKLINRVVKQMSATTLEIFQPSYESVYSIPACIEPAIPLKRSRSNEKTEDGDDLSTFSGTMWRDSGWFVVAIGTRLHIVKAMKICVDWDSWWSKQFLNRRDTKAVLHGFVYKIVNIGVDDSPDGPCGNVSPPNVLIRKGGLILFHPCDIVSRLYIIKVMRIEQNISRQYYNGDIFTGCKALYVMPGYEVMRFDGLCRVSEQLSVHETNSAITRTQLPKRCSHCGSIVLGGAPVTRDTRLSDKRIRKLRDLLNCKHYRDCYNRMEASLFRVERRILGQSI